MEDATDMRSISSIANIIKIQYVIKKPSKTSHLFYDLGIFPTPRRSQNLSKTAPFNQGATATSPTRKKDESGFQTDIEAYCNLKNEIPGRVAYKYMTLITYQIYIFV